MDRLETFRRRYAALRPGWESATALYQRWVAEALGAQGRVLDLGCGRGGIVERLGDRGRWVGVDPDLLSLREHRQPDLDRGSAASQHLPFADGSFDVVVSSWVLEHVPAPDQTFAEVGRMLRPGGRFFVLTPNAHHPLPRLSAMLAAMGRVQRAVVSRVYDRAPADTFPVQYRANTLRQIERLAVRAGLRLRRMAFVEDPAYLAWNGPSFILAVMMEGLLPATWKVHLVVELVRA
jgi:SAM-dependent methyltransferase